MGYIATRSRETEDGNYHMITSLTSFLRLGDVLVRRYTWSNEDSIEHYLTFLEDFVRIGDIKVQRCIWRYDNY